MAESRQMADKESSSRKVVEEFFYLQDRCSAHFAGLRELPAFGKTFAGFFQKTFESYTRWARARGGIFLFFSFSFAHGSPDCGSFSRRIGPLSRRTTVSSAGRLATLPRTLARSTITTICAPPTAPIWRRAPHSIARCRNAA